MCVVRHGVLALGIATLLGSCTSGPATEWNATSRAEVRAFLTHYLTTLEARDESAVGSLFVDDGRFAWFTDGTLSYGSAADVVVGMRRFEDIEFRTELHDVYVLPLGPKLAHARSGFRTRLTIPGSADHEYAGVITWLLEYEADSSRWRVLTGHTSTPAGPPTETDP